MPQAENKVKWCLNKAKRELEEGKSHRGLVKVRQDKEEAKKHIKKAEHNYNGIFKLKDAGLSDWSASAVFYTIYHCFLAIAAYFGYESRNQECTVALIEHLKETGKIDIKDEIIEALKKTEGQQPKSAIDLRENFQYGTETEIEDGQLSKLKEICKKAIDSTKKIIYLDLK